MKRLKNLLLAAGLGCALTMSHPPAGATADSPMTICYYMGNVKNNYGGTGALWYCEVWDRTELIWAYTIVEPY